VYGRVIDRRCDGSWDYKIQANDDGRHITSWIPEYRVAAVSKAINDDQIIGTRAIAAEPVKKLKWQLEGNDGELVKKAKDGELVIIDPVPKTVLRLMNKGGPY